MARWLRRWLLPLFFASSFLLLPAIPTAAAASAPSEPDWDATIIGYAWLFSIHADVSAGPIESTLDVGIEDLLKKLTWAASGGFEVRYRALLFQMDGMGQQVQDSVGGSGRSVAFAPFGGALGGVTASIGPAEVSLRSTSVMGEAALGYRALSLPLSSCFSSVPDDDSRRFRLDLLGGARYWYFRNTARLSIPPARLSIGGVAVPPGTFAQLLQEKFGSTTIPGSLLLRGSQDVFTAVASWTDSIIGFRVGADLTKTVSVAFRSDIGGFGFGDSSRFSWQVQPSVEWRFSDHWSFDGAYRVIGVDRGIVSNAILYGFQLGFGYRF